MAEKFCDYNTASASDFLPKDKLQQLQLHRLQSIVKRAYENVEHFRNRLEERNVTPDDINSLEDFKRRIPITDKSDFIQFQQERPPYGDTLTLPMEMVAHHVETSGSTGPW